MSRPQVEASATDIAQMPAPDSAHSSSAHLFTHVEEATFTRFQLSDDVAVAMEKLLSLPTLRRVEMHCGIPHFETVLRIWPRRSPPIKAVVLYCWAQAPHAFDSTPPHCAAPIKLESLTIGPACEYDDATGGIVGHIFRAVDGFIKVRTSLSNNETLHLEIRFTTKSSGLSLFTKLRVLSVECIHNEAPWSEVIAPFLAIPPLLLLLNIELQPFHDQANPVPYLSKLASRDILHATGHDDTWFKKPHSLKFTEI
ncbi:hypothetical protein B0H11DRAFT_2283080 [Mycena galericulata]|nr:hypothetical protein B0H11DRAFT_2283080 [Mycena galericulata]